MTAKPVKKEAVKQEEDGETKLKITVEKDKDFSSWYQQVLTKSDMVHAPPLPILTIA